MAKLNIFNYTLDQLKQLAIDHQLKPFVATQIFEWIYKKRVHQFNQMTNISKVNLAWLNDTFSCELLKTSILLTDKKDDTAKFLFELNDGNKIESVLMKFSYGWSICVTSQVGCNMGCKFCASGLLKKKRNLEAGEIVQQVMSVQAYLDEKYPGERITNIVVMGIGEPLDNLENVSRFLDIIKNDYGFGIGSRKVTVSTCGIVPKIMEFAHLQPQVGLAISLHAPNDELRSQIMPINRAFPLNTLMDKIDEYIAFTNRRVTFEYIMLKGVNDQPEHARQLAKLLKDKLCYVNLIPYNPVDENDFQRSKSVKEFAALLTSLGITCTTRQEKGTDIDAACGQLRSRNIK